MTPRLLREPLFHFLALGALIFAGWYWFHPPEPPIDEIVIDAAEFNHLQTLWKAQWRRAPSSDDLKAIIDRHVRQEVFYREGLRLNLDRNDEIVKRRLAQKMEAVAGDVGGLMKPVTDAELKRYFEDHADLFRLPPAYSFQQVLFLPAERAEAAATLAALRAGAPIPQVRQEKLGVPNIWNDAGAPDLANAFGEAFPEELEKLPQGRWSGPIASGYGLHLIYLESHEAPRAPDFERVKPYVRREYEYQAQLKAEEAVFQRLRTNYKIRLTAPDVPGDVRASLDYE